MKRKIQNKSNLVLRKRRVRKKVVGTEARPRLSVCRSLNHLQAQIVNDLTGITLAGVSTRSKEMKSQLKSCGNIEAAVKLGEALATAASTKGIKDVVFDRGGYLYHGRIMAFADSARKAGLNF
ncbi:MAG: large subunit ribosomal protein L18 [Candidatus Omnitrophota bacterium]|jgi:large subunit ribosomal protein L18